MNRRLPSGWNGSWNDAPVNPSVASASSAMTCAIRAASTHAARNRASRDPPVDGFDWRSRPRSGHVLVRRGAARSSGGHDAGRALRLPGGPDADGQAGAAGRHAAGCADHGSWAWLELDRAAGSGHHDELRPERELVQVMDSPAAKPEQRRDHGERGDRNKRLPAQHADQQPGAEQRDGAQGRHVEPRRLQRAQARRRGSRVGGVQDQTPAQQPPGPEPPRHGDDRVARHHDVGVPAERGRLQRHEASQPGPGPAPSARLGR